MLCISRRKGEFAVLELDSQPIGVVKILAVDRGKVVVGFDFARNVSIRRDELIPPLELETILERLEATP